jgi:hypothetical protein
MKTISKERKTESFEQKVLENLLIDSKVFNLCVNAHRGYALILRNWIKDACHKGSTPEEVALNIKDSDLPIKELIEGNPLYFNNIMLQLPQTSVLTLLS